MQKCPDCQYKTTRPKNMEKHQREHGHGGTKKQRVWKGHKRQKPQKKK